MAETGSLAKNRPLFLGISCDIPAHYYSFSFAPNPDWSSEFPPAKEIQPYMVGPSRTKRRQHQLIPRLNRAQENLAIKYGLLPHTSFNTEIEHARWNNEEQCYHVKLNVLEPQAPGKEAGHWKGSADKGRKVLRSGILKVNLIMNTSGPFTRPYTPDYAGRDSFKGQ